MKKSQLREVKWLSQGNLANGTQGCLSSQLCSSPSSKKHLMSSVDQVSSLIWSSGNIKRWAGSPLWVHKLPISTQEHSLDDSTAMHPPGHSLVPARSMEGLTSSFYAGPEFCMGSSVFVSFKETYISNRTAQWKCLLQPKKQCHYSVELWVEAKGITTLKQTRKLSKVMWLAETG